MSTAIRACGKYEYCRDINCRMLETSNTHADMVHCPRDDDRCIHTTKQFFRWAEQNNIMFHKSIEE
jgi:hypothetical protein